jgi:hypothetical protein
MPWTEDPDDPAARNICDVQSRRALRLQEMIPRLGLAQARSDYLLEYAGNNMTNEDAMKRLHGGFKGHPRRLFLPAPDSPPRPGEPARAPRADDRLINLGGLGLGFVLEDFECAI